MSDMRTAVRRGRSRPTGTVTRPARRDGDGRPGHGITVPVTGVLRLSISYADPADSCEMGSLILGAPTLKR
ncbi:hypothetical protein [Streptomyces sp. NBC_00338]|uniref:hypothetical protein n=1 Tax=Streptomyces sp. NBC_00338 TaxID=2975715 RepID=UPI002254BDBA|nr:hypothetical protein [Streptomyces sp. NBC_00338]MCX5143079.1 hypothetical protein [Streptomyces sp. NBC_00338]